MWPPSLPILFCNSPSVSPYCKHFFVIFSTFLFQTLCLPHSPYLSLCTYLILSLLSSHSACFPHSILRFHTILQFTSYSRSRVAYFNPLHSHHLTRCYNIILKFLLFGPLIPISANISVCAHQWPPQNIRLHL